jgi:putative glutamine amidotransferase
VPGVIGAPRPVIAVTGRRVSGQVITHAVGFLDAPVDAYLSEYTDNLWSAGAMPVNLPGSADPVAVAEIVDGLVLSGGDDVDPRAYGRALGASVHPVDPLRDELELGLLSAMLELEKPVLGICRGAQLINVAFGGTLVADLPPDAGESHASYDHPRDHRRHAVHLDPGTRGHDLYGPEIWVNSFHHQAVERPGRGVTVSGRAVDGVAEMIEVADLPVLGVQWHPECLDADPVFEWLVSEARKRLTFPQPREAIA